MSGGVWGTVRAEAARLFGVSRQAVTSGRFFTRWSALTSLLVGSLFLVPSIGEPTFSAYVVSVQIAILGWLVLAIPGVIAALLERLLTAPVARAIVVLMAIALIAAARPFVNDRISVALLAAPTGGEFATRISTNTLVAFPLFILVAIITTQFSASRETAARLAAALRRVDDAAERVDTFVAESARGLPLVVAQLRSEREELLRHPLSFMTVRGYSERVRAASHQLDARARSADLVPRPVATTRAVPAVVRGRDSGRRPEALARLVPTPALLVGVLYYLMCLPVILSHDRPMAVFTLLVGTLAVDLVVSASMRRLGRGLSHPARGMVFLVCWMLGGIALVGLGALTLPDLGFLGVIPIVSTPAVAAVIALSIDTYRRALRAERRATRTLGSAVKQLARRASLARAPLEAAITLLHGGVQGRCVILAAHVDEYGATPDAVARFRSETDAAFGTILRPSAAGETTAHLQNLLSVWAHVIDVTTEITPDAETALGEAALARAATDIVKEGLVNAVKHSGARSARVTLTVSEGGSLCIRVASPGVIVRTAASGRGVKSLPGHVELTQSGGDVILTARLPRDGARAAETASVQG